MYFHHCKKNIRLKQVTPPLWITVHKILFKKRIKNSETHCYGTPCNSVKMFYSNRQDNQSSRWQSPLLKWFLYDIIKLIAYQPRSLYFSKAFFEGLIFGVTCIQTGLCTEGNLHFKISWAYLIVGRKFTVFALFYVVYEGNFLFNSTIIMGLWLLAA